MFIGFPIWINYPTVFAWKAREAHGGGRGILGHRVKRKTSSKKQKTKIAKVKIRIRERMHKLLTQTSHI